VRAAVHPDHPRHILDHPSHPVHAWSHLGDAFEAFGERNYRVYFLGQCLAASGTWMQAAAVAWLVLDLTGSPLTMGTVASLQFLPILPLSLVGGMLADRCPKRYVLAASTAFQMLLAVGCGLLVLTGRIRLWELYVLSAALGTSVALSQPAARAITSELVSLDKLASGLAMTTTVMTTARFFGPALAGVALAGVGAAACFFLNAVGYLGLIASLLSLRPADLHIAREDADAPARRGGIAEMLRFVWSSPNIVFELILTALLGAFGYNFSSVLLPLIARHDHVVGARGLFAFGLAMVVGSLVGTVLSGRAKSASRALSVVSAAAFAALLLALTLTRSFSVTLVLLGAIGTALMIFGVSANTTVQLLAPHALRGRVMSLYMMCYLGTPTIGATLTGAIAQAWSVRVALVGEAAIVGIGLLLALAMLHRRLMRALPPPTGVPVPAR
jgi:MFS family permease